VKSHIDLYCLDGLHLVYLFSFNNVIVQEVQKKKETKITL